MSINTKSVFLRPVFHLAKRCYGQSVLFDRLLKAADRGVRVRLLIDDIWLAANDEVIAAIDNHPNFDIKIFKLKP